MATLTMPGELILGLRGQLLLLLTTTTTCYRVPLLTHHVHPTYSLLTHYLLTSTYSLIRRAPTRSPRTARSRSRRAAPASSSRSRRRQISTPRTLLFATCSSGDRRHDPGPGPDPDPVALALLTGISDLVPYLACPLAKLTYPLAKPTYRYSEFVSDSLTYLQVLRLRNQLTNLPTYQRTGTLSSWPSPSSCGRRRPPTRRSPFYIIHDIGVHI